MNTVSQQNRKLIFRLFFASGKRRVPQIAAPTSEKLGSSKSINLSTHLHADLYSYHPPQLFVLNHMAQIALKWKRTTFAVMDCNLVSMTKYLVQASTT